MGYLSRVKKRIRRSGKHRIRMHDPRYHYRYRKGQYKKAIKFNKKHRVAGLSPNNWISPIDFVPGVNVVNKGRRGYKIGKTGYRVVKSSKKVRKSRARVVRGVKRTYKAGSNVTTRGRPSYSSQKRRSSHKSRPRSRYYGNKKYEYRKWK